MSGTTWAGSLIVFDKYLRIDKNMLQNVEDNPWLKNKEILVGRVKPAKKDHLSTPDHHQLQTPVHVKGVVAKEDHNWEVIAA